MKMLANLVLVLPQTWTEQKQGSIVLPQQATQTFSRGLVVKVGPGLVTANGVKNEIDVVPGDYILYYKESAIPIIVAGKEHQIVQEREVLAILEPGDFNDLGDDTDATS